MKSTIYAGYAMEIYRKKQSKITLLTHISIAGITFVLAVSFLYVVSLFKNSAELANIKDQPSNYAAACNTSLISVSFPQKNSDAYEPNISCFNTLVRPYKVDERFNLSNVPSYLQNAVFVQTGNVEVKNDLTLSWTARVNAPSDVYILHRHRDNISPPSWISNSYTKISPATPYESNKSSYVLRKNLSGKIGVYDIFQYKNSPVQGTMTFGPAGESGKSAYSMYIVAFVQRSTGTTPTATAVPTSSPVPTKTATPGPATPIPATAVPTNSPIPTKTATPVPTKTATPAPVTPVPATAVPTATPTLLQEVASHNTKTNCWTLYNGHIYNITAYFGSHPGGDSKLANACGRDMTSIFNNIGSHTSTFYNPTATQILANYLIK